MSESLFDRWDIDPAAGPQAITERLRELTERASPKEQDELRRAWEELTLHPRRRIAEALSAHPETRPPLGRPPLPPRPPSPASHDGDAARLAHAPVAGAIGPAPPPPPALPPLDDDPLLGPPPRPRLGPPPGAADVRPLDARSLAARRQGGTS